MQVLFLTVVAMLWLVAACSAAQAAEARRATAVRSEEQIRVDGVLDERVWQTAPPIGELIQANPFAGGRPTEPTDVRIVYNDHTLYVGARCFYRDPSTIFASTTARDAKFWYDDDFEIVFDTFHDQRNAYFFAANAAGAMTDGRVIENQNVDISWDGIWQVRTRIDDRGWTAEFAIPFKTLSFNPDLDTWGFNVERTVSRINEESRWEAARQDATINTVARAGDLEGFEGLSQGIGVDVKPYGLLGVNRDATRPDRVQPVGDAGADIFYRITPNLLSSTTINTDFAETEVDTRQVNLTRFPLLFPEKRDFFLEDAGIFQFGIRANSTGLIPFFSRRIGLVQGRTIPILFGEKLTGSLGRLALGVLDVKTGDSDWAPAQNFTVGRAKYGFWHQSYIGGIFTHGEPTGQTDNNLAGADVALATSNFLGTGENFDFSAFGARTSTPGLHGRDAAYGAQARYPNDLVNLGYTWQEIGENFNPRLGYVRRRGVRVNSFSGRLGPRPQIWNVRQVTFGLEFDNYHSTIRNALESRTWTFTPLELSLHGGQRFEYNVTSNFERLFEPFEIHQGIAIPEGDYSFLQHALSYRSPSNAPLSYTLQYDKGAFYSGSSDQFIGTLSWRKSSRLTTGGEFRQYWVRLKEGSFDTSLAIFRFDYSFNPYIHLTNFLQYDTDSRNVGLQSRLYWIIKPGNEVYIVFNHEWQDSPFERFSAVRGDARVKLNYTFRF
jgi:hypothetical protein